MAASLPRSHCACPQRRRLHGLHAHTPGRVAAARTQRHARHDASSTQGDALRARTGAAVWCPEARQAWLDQDLPQTTLAAGNVWMAAACEQAERLGASYPVATGGKRWGFLGTPENPGVENGTWGAEMASQHHASHQALQWHPWADARGDAVLPVRDTGRQGHGSAQAPVGTAGEGGRVTLAEECRQTCQTYFPRWRAATAWSLEERPCPAWLQAQGTPHVTAAQGACDPTTRRILLPVASENVLQRQAMLMHAICHAITTVGHGARFRAQMGQAAARAWTVGATALAEALRRHAHAYRSLGGLTTCEAHKSVLPPAPYEQLRDPPWFRSTARGT